VAESNVERGNTMLKLLSITALLAAGFATLLCEESLAIPVIINSTSYPQWIVDQNPNGIGEVVNPLYRSSYSIVSPVNGSNTVRTSSFGSYPSSRSIYPIGGTPIVIINNVNIYPSYAEPVCSTVILGSPIPSPVPINRKTGAFCR